MNTQVSHTLAAIGGSMIASGWWRHNAFFVWVGVIIALVSLAILFWDELTCLIKRWQKQ